MAWCYIGRGTNVNGKSFVGLAGRSRLITPNNQEDERRNLLDESVRTNSLALLVIRLGHMVTWGAL